MEIPGLVVHKCIIDDETRIRKTSRVAIHEALEGIRVTYNSVIKSRGHIKGIKYTVVLIAELPEDKSDDRI
jgi:hypothetical protein